MYAPLSLPMSRIYILSILFYSANAILTVIFPLQASRFGMSETNIGILIGLYMLLCMIARPFAGHFIAKYSIYTTLKSLLIVHAITLFIYILFDVKSLYLVRIMQGVVTAFFSMALQLTIQEIVREDERGQGMSLYALSTVLPTIYGPALALSLFSSAPAYVTVFLTALAGRSFLYFLLIFHVHRSKGSRHSRRDFKHARRRSRVRSVNRFFTDLFARKPCCKCEHLSYVTSGHRRHEPLRFADVHPFRRGLAANVDEFHFAFFCRRNGVTSYRPIDWCARLPLGTV